MLGLGRQSDGLVGVGDEGEGGVHPTLIGGRDDEVPARVWLKAKQVGNRPCGRVRVGPRAVNDVVGRAHRVGREDRQCNRRRASTAGLKPYPDKKRDQSQLAARAEQPRLVQSTYLRLVGLVTVRRKRGLARTSPLPPSAPGALQIIKNEVNRQTCIGKLQVHHAPLSLRPAAVHPRPLRRHRRHLERQRAPHRQLELAHLPG